MSFQAVDFRVTGKVQGVWFRKHTKLEADRLGLVGHVRNMPDGSVEGFVQGPHAALEQM
jgi:acylphosphatase